MMAATITTTAAATTTTPAATTTTPRATPSPIPNTENPTMDLANTKSRERAESQEAMASRDPLLASGFRSSADPFIVGTKLGEPWSEVTANMACPTVESHSFSVESSSLSVYSQEDLIRILSATTLVDFNDELMDPLEWSVRKLVPLPAVYYWDLLEGQPDEVKELVPWKIRWWHRVIAAMDRSSHVVNRSIALPLAGALGITRSPFAYVLENMTEEEIEESKRRAAERKNRHADKSNLPEDDVL